MENPRESLSEYILRNNKIRFMWDDNPLAFEQLVAKIKELQSEVEK